MRSKAKTRVAFAVTVALVVAMSQSSWTGWARSKPASAAGRHAAAPAATTRPNILLMISDDQAWSTFNRSLMPNVYSQIADQGMLFNDAYVNSSLCCPSRSSMLTGLYATDSGVSANTDKLKRPTVVAALHDAGYRTLLAGKYLNSSPCMQQRPEFDDWYCYGESDSTQTDPLIDVNGRYVPYSGYSSDIFAGFVKHFIQTTPADQPFFAIYSPKVPHLPNDDPRNDNITVPVYRPPNFDEDTRHDNKPSMFRRGPLTPQEIATIDSNYDGMYRSSHSMDASVGDILSSLGNRADNTLVIYLSDNGFLYGEHRFVSGKEVAYQPSVNVPMAIRFPALHSTNDPVVSRALVQNTDLAPTIADAAGVPWNADGVSLLPLLSGQASSVRDVAVIEHCLASSGPACSPGNSGARFFGLVNDTYKYVEYSTGERELYNLQTDPWELNNLAGTPGVANIQQQLAAQLAKFHAPPPTLATIVSGPSGTVGAGPFTFTYFSPAIAATYRCRLVGPGRPGTWAACGYQTTTFNSLFDGNYTFSVVGVAADGTVGTQVASRSFTVSSSAPALSVADTSVTEGTGGSAGTLQFKVTLNHSTSQTVSASYETTDITAASPADYQTTSGTLTFNPFQTSQTVSVPVVGDNLHEIDETMELSLYGASNAAVNRPTGVGTIVDDDPIPTISIGATSAAEGPLFGGGTLQFPVTISPPSGDALTVSYATKNGTAVKGTDYLSTKGTLTVPAGTSTIKIPVTIIGDNVQEPDRTVKMSLSAPVGAVMGNDTAVGTIIDDDPTPTVSVGNASVVEADLGHSSTALVPVSLSVPSGQAVNIPFSTTPGTATANVDDTSQLGTLKIPAGDTTGTIQVNIIGDNLTEGTETFGVVLGSPTNATLGDASATVSIIDDESPPPVSVGDLSVDQTQSDNAKFHLTLPFASPNTVTVHYSTADGTATAPDEYGATNGTATFTPGQTDTVVNVAIVNDPSTGPYETFALQLSSPTNSSLGRAQATATIVNGAVLPMISLQPGPSVLEGNVQTTPAVFGVTLSAPWSRPVSVSYSTADGTAVAPGDYLPESGVLTIPAGHMTGQIVVPVVGDKLFEKDETFTVSIANPANARLGVSTATGTIVDDDAKPRVVVADDVVATKNSRGTETALFTITLLSPSSVATTVHYATTDQTAVAPTDYTATTGSVTIPPRATTATVAIPVNGAVSHTEVTAFLIEVLSATHAIVDDDGYAAFGVIPAGPGSSPLLGRLR